ncbi:MAG TPA: cytochrome P450 [Solirubrobacteraceae bacterium]
MSSIAVYDEHDLGSLAFWEHPMRERDEVFAKLRAEQPLSRHHPPEDVLGVGDENVAPYWALVRYEDIRHASRHPDVFCSGRGTQFGDAPQELLEATQSFIAMDAPRHTKLRGLVSSAFTPRQVRRIEDGIRANAKRIVAEVAPLGSGDFVELVAKQLPLVTISDMIGVPQEDRERVVKAADALVTATDPDVAGDRTPMEVLGESVFVLHQFASGLAEERQRSPQDDLMTALVQAEIDGERMTIPEIAAFFVLLSVAGNDTTRHTTSHALHALTTHPDQRAKLQQDRSLMPTAIEEFVRWATPVMNFRRTTTREVELHGITIPEGEKVVLFYTSGNRDERAFDDPWAFDVTRSPNHHLGFGGGGPHYCLGASLARTQLDAIFSELFDQIPDIEAGELDLYKGGAFIHGVKRLPAEWTPAG